MPDDLFDTGFDNEPGPALRALPMLAPPPQSRARFLAEVAKRRERNARPRWLPFAIAAAAVLALLPLASLTTRSLTSAPVVVTQAPAAKPDPQAERLAQLISANRSLQAQVVGGRNRTMALDGDAAFASAQVEDMVGAVDAALAQGADPARDARLWERRLQLLRALDQIQSQGALSASNGDEGVYLTSL